MATCYASPSQTHVNQLRRQLQTLRQGSKVCTEFIRMAKSLANQIAIAGTPVSYDKLISYIIGGLSPTYNAFVMTFSMITKDTIMTLEKFQSELLAHEHLLDHQVASTDPTSFDMFSQKPPTKQRFDNNQKKPFHNFTNSPQRKLFSSVSAPGPNQGKSTSSFPSNFSSPRFLQSSTLSNRVPCQICGRNNHQALDCFHRMDFVY